MSLRCLERALLAGCLLGPGAEAATLPDLPPGAGLAERALYAEFSRAATDLVLPDSDRPYFIQCDLLSGHYVTARQRFGAVVYAVERPYLTARIEVRVGDYGFDSVDFDGQEFGVVMLSLPADGDLLSYRRALWLAFDRAYKSAVDGFSEKKAARSKDEREHPPSFLPIDSIAQPRVESEAMDLDLTALIERFEAVAVLAGDNLRLERFDFSGRASVGTHITMNTEGSWLERSTGRASLKMRARLRLEDGSELDTSQVWHATSIAGLPEREALVTDVRARVTALERGRTARVVEEYVGPVLFEGQAADEFFRQLVHPAILGSPPSEEPFRGRRAADMPRSSGRVGRRLLPAGWTVVDSTPDHPESMGFYRFDDDGVRPQRVKLVEDGYVRRLLRSRIPDAEQSLSTGHGRSIGIGRRSATPGVVEVLPARPLTRWKLRRRARREASRAGSSAVLVISRLEPFSLADDFRLYFTGSGAPPGLTAPVEAVFRYSDGREETLRSLSFVGVDERLLRDLVAAGPAGELVDFQDGSTGPSRHIEAEGGHSVSWRAPDVLVGEVELRGDSGGERRVLSVESLSRSKPKGGD